MASGSYFFATAADLLPGLRRFEQTRAVRYVLTGIFDSATPVFFARADNLPELGRCSTGDAGREPAFLVLPAETEVLVRDVQLNSGKLRYAIDQLHNPNSAVLRPGGLHSESVLISGEISTTGTTPESLGLHRLMAQVVTRGFRRVKSFWLGNEAQAMLASGSRLTKDVRMSTVYDLRY